MIFGAFSSSIFILSNLGDFGYKSYVGFDEKSDVDLRISTSFLLRYHGNKFQLLERYILDDVSGSRSGWLEHRGDSKTCENSHVILDL